MGITSLEGIQSVDDVHSPGQALALAGALLARAGALVDFGASVRQTEDLAVTAVTVAEQAKAVAADRVAEAHRAGAPRRRSCRSMGVLLGDRLATDSAAMAPYATLGLWLGDFCDFAAAWQLGRITDAHVRLLRQLDTPLTHALLQREQDFLLGHAAVLSWDDFVTACRYWLNCAPRKARTALLLGTFRRQVFKPDGIPASYTKPARLFDEHQKQTLLVAARGRCQHVGCSSPWITLQADHKRPSVLGGLTNLLNGQILCEWCNKWKRDRLL